MLHVSLHFADLKELGDTDCTWVDYLCREFCKPCSVTFTEASKFIYHGCSKIGPIDQQTYIERWRQSLGGKIERELGFKNRDVSAGSIDYSASARLKSHETRDATTVAVTPPVQHISSSTSACEMDPSSALLQSTGPPSQVPNTSNQQIALSNDGVNPVLDYQLYTLFDYDLPPVGQAEYPDAMLQSFFQ
jgi:hypothetical protein